MDISTILRPEELPFEVPPELELAINEYIAAVERNDTMNIDAYIDEVWGAGRCVSEDKDMWVRWYYTLGGWQKYGKTAVFE